MGLFYTTPKPTRGIGQLLWKLSLKVGWCTFLQHSAHDVLSKQSWFTGSKKGRKEREGHQMGRGGFYSGIFGGTSPQTSEIFPQDFCETHGCVQQADRQRHRPSYMCSNRPHLCILCMWHGLKIHRHTDRHTHTFHIKWGHTANPNQHMRGHFATQRRRQMICTLPDCKWISSILSSIDTKCVYTYVNKPYKWITREFQAVCSQRLRQ